MRENERQEILRLLRELKHAFARAQEFESATDIMDMEKIYLDKKADE